MCLVVLALGGFARWWAMWLGRWGGWFVVGVRVYGTSVGGERWGWGAMCVVSLFEAASLFEWLLLWVVVRNVACRMWDGGLLVGVLCVWGCRSGRVGGGSVSLVFCVGRMVGGVEVFGADMEGGQW